MKEYESAWPHSFHQSIPKKVTTVSMTKKHIKVGDAPVFDTETIYARAMGLQSTSRALDTTTLLRHELSPYPTSIFDEYGHMREAQSKANLKNALKVEVSEKTLPNSINAIFIDGCAVLWAISWPVSGTVQHYLDAFRRYIHNQLKICAVYLVFDR